MTTSRFYGFNAVIGTTYTPSGLLYAAFESPQITHNTLGTFPFFSFIESLKLIKFLAASSILFAPSFISNAHHSPLSNSITLSISSLSTSFS